MYEDFCLDEIEEVLSGNQRVIERNVFGPYNQTYYLSFFQKNWDHSRYDEWEQGVSDFIQNNDILVMFRDDD